MKKYLLVFFVVFVLFFTAFFSVGIFMDYLIIPSIIYTRVGEWRGNIVNVDFLLHIKRSSIISGLVSMYIILSMILSK